MKQSCTTLYLSLSHTHTHAVGLFAMMCLDENVALYPAEVVYSSGMITDFAWISRIHTNYVLQNYSVKRMRNYLKHMANDNLYIFTGNKFHGNTPGFIPNASSLIVQK